MEEKAYIYKCKKCEWQGTEKELDSELVDTCLGDDPIYICPECGSYEVKCTYKTAGNGQQKAERN